MIQSVRSFLCAPFFATDKIQWYNFEIEISKWKLKGKSLNFCMIPCGNQSQNHVICYAEVGLQKCLLKIFKKYVFE